MEKVVFMGEQLQLEFDMTVDDDMSRVAMQRSTSLHEEYVKAGERLQLILALSDSALNHLPISRDVYDGIVKNAAEEVRFFRVRSSALAKVANPPTTE